MEDNLKRIVCEVTRLCREAGVEINSSVIAYVACLQDAQGALDSFTGSRALASEAFDASIIAALGKYISDVIIRNKGSPYMATAKLQMTMELTFKKQREAIEQEKAAQQEDIDMLSRSITGTPASKSTTVQSYERLHRLVVEYVCKKGGLDRALVDEAASEEVKAAIESIFPLSSIARFLTLDDKERLNQIEELARITLGICLYNRQAGKGGGRALPPDTQTYLPQAARLQRDLKRHAVSLAADIKMLGAMLAGTPPSIDAEEVKAAQEHAQLESIALGQAFATFQQLSADLSAGLDVTRQIEEEISQTLSNLISTVGASNAVSKESVYPLFDRAGALHMALIEELRLLVVRQRLADSASELLGGYSSTLPEPQAPGGSKPSATSNGSSKLYVPTRSELEALDEAEEPSCPTLPEGFELISVDSNLGPWTLEQALLALQGLSLAGLCASSLADSRIAIANPSVGLVRILSSEASGAVDMEGAILGFSSNSALEAFSADPASTLARIDAAVLKEPLLARLLGKSHLHPSLDIQKVSEVMSGSLKVDFSCQTPVHFVEQNIDPSYEWNEWALRRRALSLANLRQKRTHSTQSVLTHFKRDGDTQVWLPKESQVQTRVNKGQSMPKKMQYIAGLRGPPASKMNVIRLDLDLGQPHEH